MGGRGSLTLGKIAGIPVRLHFTFLIILPYLAWAIARTTPMLSMLAGLPPQSLLLPPLALGAILALGLFACVLVHEFAHIAVGRRGGARFAGVTLMIVGGVSEVLELPRRPGREAAMAIAGPLASFLLAAGAYGGFLASTQPDLQFGLFYLAYVNFGLALFNLVPAFPMDGGRILRALLAMITNRLRATRIAAWVGQAVALFFLGAGFYSFNVLLLLIGVLVIGGARAELEMVRTSSILDGLTVEQAMQRFVPTVELDDPLVTVVERMRRELRTLYFVLSRGDYAGVLTASAALERAQGSFARVSDALRTDVPALQVGQSLAIAAQLLRNSGLSALPVLEGKVLLGQVSTERIDALVRSNSSRKPEERTAELREREA